MATANIVGQSVRINGKAATIIGVMPQILSFHFPNNFGFPFTMSFLQYRAVSS